nr:ATP-binding protein [Chiayiivirga flava]
MLLAIPIFGALVWLLLGVGLRPVATLARDLEQREASDLRPLPTDALPFELRQLAASANALLRRLDASFARERRFSSDAAHELRTPLAALRIQCENLAFALPGTNAPVDKLLAGIERLDHLVQQILMLSRVAPEQAMRRFEAIALHAAIARSVADQGAALQEKSIEIELLGDAATVHGDAYAIDSLIGNLIGNAIRYTPTGGRIRVQTVLLDSGVALDVIDSGVGIAPELRARVFDRFYRVDGDRHDSGTSGCGLGLSIVKAVADLHGADIELRDSVFATGLWVRVVFPRGGRA